MSKYKVAVYAICKNEEKFVERWYHSICDADYIVVLDTGSEDHTLSKLKQYPIIVAQEIITPFQFDKARNKALEMVPSDADICISIDLDEVLTPNWYNELINQWQLTTSAAYCRFVWHFNTDGSEDGVFWPMRIHTRHNFIWTHAIHEILTYTGNQPSSIIYLKNFQFNHHPDPSKPRNYLKLLEETVKSSPNDARDLFYLGREYMYTGNWQSCIQTLSKYLMNPLSWNEERSAALRFMAKSYLHLNQTSEAITRLEAAIIEAPWARESYIDLAYIYYAQSNWQKTAEYVHKALSITKPSETFINDGYAWDATPYDLGCIAYFHLKNYALSLACAYKCLEFSPNEQRFVQNAKWIQNYILSQSF